MICSGEEGGRFVIPRDNRDCVCEVDLDGLIIFGRFGAYSRRLFG